MRIKWVAADARAVVLPDGDEVPVEKGAVVDVPDRVAESLIEQGLAEAATTPVKKEA